jgi:hypothetical protein
MKKIDFYGTMHDGMVTYNSGRLWVKEKSPVKVDKNVKSPVMNRKLKDRDTYLTMFPVYRLSLDPKESTAKDHFYYHPVDTEGKRTHHIDRKYARKCDNVRKYHDEMIKVESMRRVFTKK